ncbi:MAG: hypothetical protein ACKVOH_06355 [Chlamydiales bacterium]
MKKREQQQQQRIEFFDKTFQQGCIYGKYPLSLLQEKISSYVENIDTRYFVLKIGEHLLPITVNNKEYQNSYLTSNYFAVNYYKQKILKRRPFLGNLQKPFINGVGALLKLCKINKAVIVNNHLLTANILPQLTQEEIAQITDFLMHRFPDHLLIFRNLDSFTSKELLERFRQQHYHLFFSRNIYVFDPTKKVTPRQLYHHRRDLRLLEKEGYVIERHIAPEDFKRCLELFSSLYREKHTLFGPAYTELFLQESDFFWLVLKKGEKIEGVFALKIWDRAGTIPFFGYNIHAPNHKELYRILTTLVIKEGERLGVPINDGSGGEETKSLRGMSRYPEYTAIYAKHLPWARRYFWHFSEKIGSSISGSFQP